MSGSSHSSALFGMDPESIRQAVKSWNLPFRNWDDLIDLVDVEPGDSAPDNYGPEALRARVRSQFEPLKNWGQFSEAIEQPASPIVTSGGVIQASGREADPEAEISRQFGEFLEFISRSEQGSGNAVGTTGTRSDTVANGLSALTTVIQMSRNSDALTEVREKRSLVPVLLKFFQLRVQLPSMQGSDVKYSPGSADADKMMTDVRAAFSECLGRVDSITDEYRFNPVMKGAVKESLIGVPFARVCDLHRDLHPDDIESKLSLVAVRACQSFAA